MASASDIPEVPEGDWVGVDYLLPGKDFKSTLVRLSKTGKRCKFVRSRYIPIDATWYDRNRNDIEVKGWSVTQWFWPK